MGKPRYKNPEWIGKKFGRLTIIGFDKCDKYIKWICDCDCGNQRSYYPQSIISGCTKSCGCLKKERKGKSIYLSPDYIGRKFGKLTVIGFDRRPDSPSIFWLCRCDCGTTKSIRAQHVYGGRQKSCGCWQKERSSLAIGKNPVKSRLYNIWQGMKRRCDLPSHRDYKNYGGRGISICDEWRDFSTFFDWAIEAGYADGLTIDRRNNDGDYEPSNCRWATAKIQANNRRPRIGSENINPTTRICEVVALRLDGKTYAEIAREMGVSRQYVHQLLVTTIKKVARNENFDYLAESKG